MPFLNPLPTFVPTVLASAALAVSLAAPVHAADVTMTGPEAKQVQIKCDTTTCRVKEKPAGGKWKTVENTQGGNRNFDKLKEKYRQAGFQ